MASESEDRFQASVGHHLIICGTRSAKQSVIMSYMAMLLIQVERQTLLERGSERSSSLVDEVCSICSKWSIFCMLPPA